MITGNWNWQNALAQTSKQPLYVFEFLDFGIILTSFSLALLRTSRFGYGVTLYGVDPYGT